MVFRGFRPPKPRSSRVRSTFRELHLPPRISPREIHNLPPEEHNAAERHKAKNFLEVQSLEKCSRVHRRNHLIIELDRIIMVGATRLACRVAITRHLALCSGRHGTAPVVCSALRTGAAAPQHRALATSTNLLRCAGGWRQQGCRVMPREHLNRVFHNTSLLRALSLSLSALLCAQGQHHSTEL